MNQSMWAAVDSYIADVMIPPDAALAHALASSAAAGLPAISVAPNQGKLLQLIARILNARRILEIGTLGGYSTIWMARALPADGRLITLEYDAHHATVARNNIAHAGLSSLVDVRVGRAIETLPTLVAAQEGPFDLIFIDADKANIPGYFEWSLKLSREGTVIIVDNVIRDGHVIESESTDANVLGVRRFNELLRTNRRVDATCLQTVGSKGYDGLTIARVMAAV